MPEHSPEDKTLPPKPFKRVDAREKRTDEKGEPRKSHSKLYVMLSSADVSRGCNAALELFQLQYGLRTFIGFCLPYKAYTTQIGEAAKAHILRVMDAEEQEKHHANYARFDYKMTLEHADEFNAMMASPHKPASKERKVDMVRTRLFARPFVLRYAEMREHAHLSRGCDIHFKPIDPAKFRVETNPHLIPTRFPDGLECFLRLDLAAHSRHPFLGAQDSDFLAYHSISQQQRESIFRRKEHQPPASPNTRGQMHPRVYLRGGGGSSNLSRPRSPQRRGPHPPRSHPPPRQQQQNPQQAKSNGVTSSSSSPQDFSFRVRVVPSAMNELEPKGTPISTKTKGPSGTPISKTQQAKKS